MTKWVTKKLGEIGNVAMCKRIFSFETTPEGEVPFYKIGTFGKKADAYISKTKYEEYKTKFSYPKKGDILLSASGTIGRTVVYDGEPAYFQDSNIIWLSHDEKVVLNDFLFYLYKNTTWNLEGSTIARLYNDNFYKIEIPIPIQADGTPDLTEQKRIASILSSADNVIATSEALIEKYKSIKQGMLSDLLTPKKGWKKVKLGECLSIGNGQDYKHLHKGDIPVYGTGGVMTYVDDYLFDGETVCIGRKGTINKPIFHCGKIWTVDTLFYTHSFVNVLPLFMYYAFCCIDWLRYNEATGVPSLSKETIYKIEINIPEDLAEQRRIAEILSSVDAKIVAEGKVVEKYKGVKKGLMEELLKSEK